MRVTFVAGTRPEIIKISPVVRAMRAEPGFTVTVLATGQHRALADQAFRDVGIIPDIELGFSGGALGLGQSVAAIMNQISGRLHSAESDLVLVQGDTNSALAGAMAGFYAHIPVGHIEAGLRSGVDDNPYPEEMNRKLIAHLASLHFAPTRRAAANLHGQGIDRAKVAVTGNTIVDAVHAHAGGSHPCFSDGRRLLTVTCHRRESWGLALAEICGALTDLIASDRALDIAFPQHGNPALRERIAAELGHANHRLHLLDPQPFDRFLGLLRASTLILTDSGGVQEEAISLGRPVLVCRDHGERDEGLETGLMVMIGTGRVPILAAARQWLAQAPAPLNAANPFGDGFAAGRIVTALARWRQGLSPLLAPEAEFGGVAA